MSGRHAQRLLRGSGLSAAARSVSSVSSATSATSEAVLARLAPSSGCTGSGQQPHLPGFHSSPSAWQPGSAAQSFASSTAVPDAQQADVGTTNSADGAAVNGGAEEQYTQIGKITSGYQVPRKLAFAVVEVGPTQFKVSQGDTIVTEKLRGVDVNDKLSLNRVLMLGSPHETIIGRPFIPEASVTAAVEEQFQDGKVLIFKKRRRKHSRRMNGHRQELTTLRILEVGGIEAEAPQQLKAKAQWWQSRKAAADAEAAAAFAA